MTPVALYSGAIYRLQSIAALAVLPAVAIFVSSNIVNVGNLAFNMVFSRMLGPELFGELAILLTLKLAVFGVAGTVQLAVSQTIAAGRTNPHAGPAPAIDHLHARALKWSALSAPIVLGIALAFGTSRGLGLSSPWLLLLLGLALPFAIPLAILRGVAFGTMSINRIVASANIEMVVRLIGAAVAWRLGFGIEGIVVALVLSIVAAWAILKPLRPRTSTAHDSRLMQRIAVASLPFAVLHLTQVITLDGEIFLAGHHLGATETGHVAVLTLFQRIAFFACFSLASVLLPSVALAANSVRSILRNVAPVAAIFIAFNSVFLAVTFAFPQQIVGLLAGAEYSDAAPILWLASVTAVAFSLNFLLSTFLAANGDNRGIWATAAVSAAQIITIYCALRFSEAGIEQLLTIKVLLQASLAVALVLLTIARLGRNSTPCPNPV